MKFRLLEDGQHFTVNCTVEVEIGISAEGQVLRSGREANGLGGDTASVFFYNAVS